MRGDRPKDAKVSKFAMLATPHARGSTFLGSVTAKGEGGYPACAGIDPEDTSKTPTLLGLPRMRGDRPGELPSHQCADTATPHARGSTSEG